MCYKYILHSGCSNKSVCLILLISSNIRDPLIGTYVDQVFEQSQFQENSSGYQIVVTFPVAHSVAEVSGSHQRLANWSISEFTGKSACRIRLDSINYSN